MRLSRSLLLAGSAIGTDFEVTSCENQTTNAAEMTISVDQAYMELHHQALTTGNGFDLVGGDYVKVIPGSALTLNMEDSTYVYLEHQLVTADEAVPDSPIHFAGRTTTFKCRYPRAVNVGDTYTLPPNVDPSPYVENGNLHYDFGVGVANGRTTVTINPAHGIPSLEANVQNCEVSHDGVSDTVFPVRNQATWGDTDVCIDNRIETNFAYSNGGAVVDWRTFHFSAGNNISQEQRITCAINVSDTLTVSAPSACSCTTGQQACKDIVDGVTYRMPDSSVPLTRNFLAQHDGPYASGLTIPILYEVKFEMNLAQQQTGYNGILYFRVDGAGPPGEDNSPPDFSYPNGIPCGASAPGLYLSPSGMGTGVNMVIVTCINGNSNRYRSNIISSAIFGQWIEVTTGQRYNSNGDLVWYLNVGTEIAWEELQTTPQQFTNVDLLIGQREGTDTTGGFVRDLTLTDMTP